MSTTVTDEVWKLHQICSICNHNNYASDIAGQDGNNTLCVACEQAPGEASDEQTFRREAPGNRSLHAFSQIAAASHAEIILLTVKFQPIIARRK